MILARVFDPWLVSLSMITAIFASVTSLHLIDLSKTIPSKVLKQIVILVASMEMTLTLRYDLIWYAVSIVVAVCLAVLALYSRVGLKVRFLNITNIQSLYISGAIMGFAISGRHYTGMVAARVIVNEGFQLSQTAQSNDTFLAVSVAFIAISLAILVLAVTGLLRLIKTI